VTGTGQLARCFQHGTDHVNGIVFGDRLPGRRRRRLYDTRRENSQHYPAIGLPDLQFTDSWQHRHLSR